MKAIDRAGRGPQQAAVVLAALVVVLAGCGGDGHGNAGMMGNSGGMMSGAGETMPAGSPTNPPAGSNAQSGATAGNGAALFLSNGCGGCHTLAAAGTTGTVGPDLDQAQPTYQRAVQTVTNGGGGMPAFAGSLTIAQIRAVARYVAASTH